MQQQEFSLDEVSKTERKWKSMAQRGLKKFATDHSKTFRRRIKRGIPSRYRWVTWQILTGMDEFLKSSNCGMLIPEMFGTPVLPRCEASECDASQCQDVPCPSNSGSASDPISVHSGVTSDLGGPSSGDGPPVSLDSSSFATFQQELTKRTEEYRKQLLKNSHALSPKQYYDKLAATKSSYFGLIEIDTSRTFPELPQFNKAVQRQLLSILNAYANFAPHIGYCQGMNFVCGFLLLIAGDSKAEFGPFKPYASDSPATAAGSGTTLGTTTESPLPSERAEDGAPTAVSYETATYEEYEVFYMLCLLMGRYNLHGFYRESFPLLDPFVEECQRRCRTYCPSLISHFEKENVLAPVYIHQWFLTLFVTSLPAGATVVLWDYVLASNVHSVVSITMSLLSVLQSFLLRLRFEGIVRFLKSLRNSGNCDEFRIGRMLVKQAEDFQPVLTSHDGLVASHREGQPRPAGQTAAIDFRTGKIDWSQVLYVSAATLYSRDNAEPGSTVQLDLTPPSGEWNNPFESIAADADPDSDEEPSNKKTTTRHFFSRQR